MVDDHEDYETGAAPAAHKVSHQDGGTDEISVAGLSGETAQLAAHKILPAIHHVRFTAAEARAAINNIFGADGKADVNINLDTHKLINVVDPVGNQDADTKIARATALAAHAILPTVHQDAPGLIETHRLIAGAHHAKYTNAEAVAAIYAAKPCFLAKLTNTVTDVTGDGTWYTYPGAIWTENKDQGNNFVNGVFTAPSNGVYLLSVLFNFLNVAAAHTLCYAYIVTTSASYLVFQGNPGSLQALGSIAVGASLHAIMSTGHTASLSIMMSGGAKVVDVASVTFFGGSRII